MRASQSGAGQEFMKVTTDGAVAELSTAVLHIASSIPARNKF